MYTKDKCNKHLRENSQEYSRTCAVCGLGPCRFENEADKDNVYLRYNEVISIIKDEPEYPKESSLNLQNLIKQAVLTQDEDWILHMMQQAVRQTKESIITKLEQL